MKELKTDTGTLMYIDLMKRVLTASIYDESAWSIIQVDKLPPITRPFRLLRKLIQKAVLAIYRTQSTLLIKARPYNVKNREEGLDWPLFGYSMVGQKRMDNIQTCVEDVLKNDVPGDFIETGAWRGGSTIFMRALLNVYGDKKRKVWVADSFEGLPVPKSKDDGWDLSAVQTLKVSLEQVKSNFERFSLLDDQVRFLKGWFCDTLPDAPIEKLSILRLDGDLYHSTMDSLKNLYHKVSKGGYVIVDDYYSWPACQKAVDEFLEENSINANFVKIDGSSVYWQV